MKKKILLGLVAFLIIAQFIRPDRSLPDYDASLSLHRMHRGDAMAADLFKHGCYDCHSYEREYPWYSDIAPISWWIQGHVDNASANVNYSLWGTYSAEKRAHKLSETIEEIELGHMPPKSFKWMHPEADWTAEQKALVLDYLKSIR